MTRNYKWQFCSFVHVQGQEFNKSTILSNPISPSILSAHSHITYIQKIKAKATEMYTGHDTCQEKSKTLLIEMGLPNGLLPLQDIVECG